MGVLRWQSGDRQGAIGSFESEAKGYSEAAPLKAKLIARARDGEPPQGPPK